MSNELLLRKVRAGCLFGVPSETIAEQIVSQVRALADENADMHRRLTRVREKVDSFIGSDKDWADHVAREILEVLDGPAEAV